MKENIAFQSLYKPDATNFSDEKLETYSRSAYNTFIRCYNEDHYKNLCNITKQQSLSQAWNIHRAGRITASNSKMAFETKVESPSKRFFNQLIQCGSFFGVPATWYGKYMEPIAWESFTECISKHHEHVLFKETVLHVYPNYPYIGASPDGIVCCSCHGESLLEIKCPFKYRENLKGWEFDKDFPISASGEIKKLHRYYYQMQHQMFVTNKRFLEMRS